MKSSSIHTLKTPWTTNGYFTAEIFAVLASNPRLTSLSLQSSIYNSSLLTIIAQSPSVTSLTLSPPIRVVRPLLAMRSLTELNVFLDFTTEFCETLRTLTHPPPLTSLHIRVDEATNSRISNECARLISQRFPQLRSLHLITYVELSAFDVLPCVEEFSHSLPFSNSYGFTRESLAAFLSRVPALVSLNMHIYMEKKGEGWGDILASSCPHLKSLVLNAAVDAKNLHALSALSLTSLFITSPCLVNRAVWEPVGRLHTLRSLRMSSPDTFVLADAQQFASLHSLTELELYTAFGDPENKAAVFLLRALPALSVLHVSRFELTSELAHAIVEHPSLRDGCVGRCDKDDSTALSFIVSHSKSVTSLHSDRHNITLDCVQRNVHLLSTNLFHFCPELTSDWRATQNGNSNVSMSNAIVVCFTIGNASVCCSRRIVRMRTVQFVTRFCL